MAYTATPRDRIDMKIDPELKLLAERATAVCGYATLTDFITSLIRENAPKILQEQKSIQLTQDQFDSFMAACNDVERKPSKRLSDVAKKLDAEGF